MKGLLALLLLAAGAVLADAQDQQVVCNSGEGHFEAQLPSGAGVQVGPPAEGAFAARQCSASLTWNGRAVLQVGTANQIDLDVMGADLGFKVPVAAFQIRQHADDWRASYAIYSLGRAPRLLEKLTGGDQYRAVDTDFDGRIAIWTTDAEAVDGLDGLHYADFDLLPMIALRYEHGRLEDVSAEYPGHYDQRIAPLLSDLTPESLAAFRKSDGRLEDGYRPWPQLIPLRKIKARVLAIVWAYLYSGRRTEAWSQLVRMWPSADEQRAKATILAARAKGFEARVAGVAPLPSGHHRRHQVVYDVGKSKVLVQFSLDPLNQIPSPSETGQDNTLADTAPQPIAMTRNVLANRPETVVLQIDAAGKVWSAKMAGKAIDRELLDSAKGWKFIPGFKNGDVVACRVKMDVSPYR